MSYARSKGALNYCIRRVRVGTPQSGSMEVFIFHRNITAKTFLKCMMSSSDDMIDTNEMNTHIYNSVSENEPPLKRFKHFNLVCHLQEQDSASPVAPL